MVRPKAAVEHQTKSSLIVMMADQYNRPMEKGASQVAAI
jgi:hypothetical protein